MTRMSCFPWVSWSILTCQKNMQTKMNCDIKVGATWQPKSHTVIAEVTYSVRNEFSNMKDCFKSFQRHACSFGNCDNLLNSFRKTGTAVECSHLSIELLSFCCAGHSAGSACEAALCAASSHHIVLCHQWNKSTHDVCVFSPRMPLVLDAHLANVQLQRLTIWQASWKSTLC